MHSRPYLETLCGLVDTFSTWLALAVIGGGLSVAPTETEVAWDAYKSAFTARTLASKKLSARRRRGEINFFCHQRGRVLLQSSTSQEGFVTISAAVGVPTAKEQTPQCLWKNSELSSCPIVPGPSVFRSSAGQNLSLDTRNF